MAKKTLDDIIVFERDVDGKIDTKKKLKFEGENTMNCLIQRKVLYGIFLLILLRHDLSCIVIDILIITYITYWCKIYKDSSI